MRKNFLILKSFYKNILIPAAFLMIITIIAELLLVGLLSTYRYYTRTDRLFESLVQGNDAVYVSRFTLEGPDETFYSALGSMSAVKEVYKYEACGSVTYNNGRRIQIMLANTEMLRDYELLNSKSYYSETGFENGAPQGIAVGDFIDTNGEAQNVQFDYGEGTLSVRLLGNIVSPYYIPTFTKASTEITSYKITEACNDTILMKDSPEIREFLSNNAFRMRHYGISFILLFNDCTEREKQAVYDFLEKHDLHYTATDTILDNSHKITADTLEQMMPLPIYLALLSAILTLCFSILFLHGKMDLMLTFYLCGCSKKRGYGIMALSLGIIGALASLVSIIILTIRKGSVLMGIVNTDQFLLDYTVYVFLICYWLLLLLLSVFASFLIYRRKSCALIRRKVEL